MADEKDIADDSPTVGGGRKRLIIAAGVLVLLIGAAGTAFFLLDNEEPVLAEGEEAVSEPAEVEEGEPVYHSFEPAFVVSLPPGGPAGMLQIGIDVMTRTPGVAETLAANDPMLRHHMLNLLEAQQAADLMTVEGKQALQEEIQGLLSEKLKELNQPGEIKGVFFTQLVMQ
jgi:flagellar FliL protein